MSNGWLSDSFECVSLHVLLIVRRRQATGHTVKINFVFDRVQQSLRNYRQV